MKATAAVLIETGKPLEIELLEIPVLQKGQVLVQIAFSGVCHTQILEARGYKGIDKFLPHCMGHEGTGIVLEVGQGVTKIQSGDPVLMSWIKGSGLDVPGTQYRGSNNQIINAGAVTTFCSHAVISENRLTKMPVGMDLSQGTMIGCAVATGMGSVFRVAEVKAGQSVAVFGVGGIGLCAVAAAKMAKASHIITVDINKSKLEVAKIMGSTHCVDGNSDPIEAIKEIIKGGVDVTVEATGLPHVMRNAFEIVRPQGGISVVIGNAHHDQMLTIDPKHFNMGKQIRGTWGGNTKPDEDFPNYCECLMHGDFSLEPLSSNTYTLEQINGALNDLENGKTVRPIIQM
jgi:S-(hydroxymethyl)glutathione dehydrogenase/alcohol dehydrogenase